MIRRRWFDPSHARSGPDWSSLCANWLTEWERKNDTVYRDKIIVGMNDIRKAPLRLVSGPDFEFDPESVHLPLYRRAGPREGNPSADLYGSASDLDGNGGFA